MGRKYIGPTSLEKIFELILEALDKKQDKMDEITKEDVKKMWDELNAPAADAEEEEEEEPEAEPEAQSPVES